MTPSTCRERLEKAEQEWEKLSDGLADLLSWIESRKKKVVEEQPIGGSLSAVMQQSAFVKNLQREMETKTNLYKSTVAEAHSFLMQHDLRPKLHSPQVLDDDYEDEGEFDGHGNLEPRAGGLGTCYTSVIDTYSQMEAAIRGELLDSGTLFGDLESDKVKKLGQHLYYMVFRLPGF